jgi:outer membrane protein, heavy metal efflux system
MQKNGRDLVQATAVPLLLLAMAGCASTPAAPDRTTVSRGLVDRGVDAGSLPARQEWSLPPGASIDDGLAADEAVAIALWNNPDFQAALGDLGIARADLIQAGALKNPILSLLFPLGPKQFEATLNWPIDTFWQRPKRIEDAKINAEAVAQRLVAHGLRLVAETKLAYIDVLSAEAALGVAAEQADLAKQIADLAAGRLRAGDISDFEARIARTDAARLEASRIARASARDLALVRLRTLLGLAHDAAALKLTDSTAATPASCGTLDALIKDALAARPDVRAAELQIDGAGVRAGLERSKIIALTASLDINGQGREGFEMGPGLGIELPILSQNQGGRARAAAELEQASRRYLAVRATVAAGVQAALVGLDEARRAGEILGDDIGASITRARQQAQGLYTAGEISLLDLLETRRRLNDTEIMRLEASIAARRALVRLEEAVGRPCSR